MSQRQTADSELDFTSSAFPGGSLLASVYDQAYVRLSDRGGSSNAIGDRWAEMCAAALTSGQGELVSALTAHDTIAETIVRLDDIPEVARIASRNKLQNPDFLMIGQSEGRQVLWSADAKFSVDTARSKQVSGDVVRALVDLGNTVSSLLPPLDPGVEFRDGVFLCPDYALTHRLLRERRGPRRATVRIDEVRLLPVTPGQFLEPMGQQGLRSFLASLDNLPIDPTQSLMLALFYFRLARAALGCWQDQTAPLLAFRDKPVIDEAAVENEARSLATMRTTGWGLIQRWNDKAEQVRQQRVAVDQVTSLPVNGKLLRQRTEEAAAAASVEPPSGSKVRRVLGSWYREQIRQEFGPLPPPIENFGALLDNLGRYACSLEPDLELATAGVIDELVSEAPALTT